MASQTDFIQYKFEHYCIRENHSKDALNHRELCEIMMRASKNILTTLFRGGTLSGIPLRPVLISI